MKHALLPPHPPLAGELDLSALLRADQPQLLPVPAEEPFDLHHTFRCGQAFRWQQHGDTWYGPYGGGSLAVRQVGGGVEVRALGAAVTVGEVAGFLGLSTSLREVYRRLEEDRWVAAAIAATPGLRILRQDPWECLVGFVCSQNSNIPKIERSLEYVAREWGTVHRWPEGVEVASLPAPEALAAVGTELLRTCGAGYRCRYLIGTAIRVAAGETRLAELRALPYRDALEELLLVPGVGRKVADCVLVFALDKPEACPVDVWVRRVIHELYPQALQRYLPDAAMRADKPLSAREYDAMLEFAWSRWGRLAGYAQQYLFHARRTGRIGGSSL